MVKFAQRYLEIDPWKLIEKGFHEERTEVSESLFSLSNEYMGVRGFFDEGYPGKSLIGTYLMEFMKPLKTLRKVLIREFLIKITIWLTPVISFIQEFISEMNYLFLILKR